MADRRRGRRRDLWGAAQNTAGTSKLLIGAEASVLVSVKVSTEVVIDGQRVTVKSIQKSGSTYTIVAEGGGK